MSDKEEKGPGSFWLIASIVCLLAFVFFNLANDLRKAKQQKGQNEASVPTAEVAQTKKQ